MNPKMKAIKTQKVQALVKQTEQEIRAQYLKDITPRARESGISEERNLFLGSCIWLNHLMCERLIDNGIAAKLVAGRATYGINKNQYGVVDFGYTDNNMETLTQDGRIADVGFIGHCWIEIKKLDLIIDLTLSHLKQQTAQDNQHRGINDSDYLLNENKVILDKSELTARNKIIAGAIGYNYQTNADIAEKAFTRLQLIKDYLIDIRGQHG